jgi:hypothetical protein
VARFTHGDECYDFGATTIPSKGNKGKGKVVLVRVKLTSGKKTAPSATFAWKAAGETLLTDADQTFYSSPEPYSDFDATLSPETEVNSAIPGEGMFALRMAPLEEDQPKGIAQPIRTGKLVNAQNKMSEKNVWGKRSQWADYSGKIDGQTVGIAIFDNPSNPRYPTYWHARGGGLFATNIFGVHDFENDKNRDASLTIRPGQPLRFRFRVVIHPGDSNAAGIGDLYEKYAAGK